MATKQENILVLGALGFELKGIAKGLESLREDGRLPGAKRGTIGDRELVLVRTGVGRAAKKAAREAIRAIRPDALLCAGTAGGLDAGLKIGDVVAAREVRFERESPRASAPALVEAALEVGAREGTCLTVPKPLCSPEEKAKAAKVHGATVCDMEAFHVAGPALAAGVPFLALKVVSDEARDRLPDAARFTDATGALDGLAFARHLALHPDEAARSARFLRNAGRAASRLAAAVLRLARRGATEV